MCIMIKYSLLTETNLICAFWLSVYQRLHKEQAPVQIYQSQELDQGSNLATDSAMERILVEHQHRCTPLMQVHCNLKLTFKTSL